jgi:hypothetical protein
VLSLLTFFAHFLVLCAPTGGETLFVPHGTEDDPGGDIRIPAVCLRKKDGDMLLAIASLGHQGTAQITMTF